MAAIGRPTKYKPEYAEQYYKLALLGLTDVKIAEYFEVTESTIYEWKKEFPEFSEAGKKAKELADGDVVKSLYERALGYSHEADDIKAVDGQIVITKTIKHYPPDPASMIFWLKNRQPKLWREKPVDDGGNENAPPVNITFNVRDQVDVDKLEVEVEERIKRDRIE